MDFYFEDKSPGIIGQMAHNIDPNNTPELSPVAANDDVVEGAALDELDEDDPFSKRRYWCSTCIIYFSHFVFKH